MTRKQFFIIGAHLLLVILLLTSAVSAQFMRVTGGGGEGYGYGFGYGFGYGWDGPMENFTGYRLTTDGLAEDAYGYGYGIGFKSYTATYDNGTGIITDNNINNFIFSVMAGQVELIGLQEVDDQAMGVTGFRFLYPVEYNIGDVATIDIEQGTTFTVDDGVVATFVVESSDPEEDMTTTLVSTSTVVVSGLPTGYAAVTDGAIQFGLPDLGLTVSPPITININVGTARSGETLKVLRQAPGSSDWTSIAECTVSGAGLCTFTTDHLSSFTTATYTATPATPASNGSHSSGYTQLAPIVKSITFSKTLRFGLYGTDVKKLQQLLKDLGYLKIKNTTNYFGSMTRAALRKYQKAHGLRITGIVDLATRQALNSGR